MKFYKNIILSTPMLILPFAMMSASCNSANNPNINSETLNKYKNQKQKLLDLLNQNADYSFCMLYKNIYSAINKQIDKSNKEEVQKWINDTDSLITQYENFKSNIKPAEKVNSGKSTALRFFNIISFPSTASDEGLGFYPSSIIKEMKNAKTLVKQLDLLNRFLKDNGVLFDEEDPNFKNISIDFNNSTSVDRDVNQDESLILTFVKTDVDGKKEYIWHKWSDIGKNNKPPTGEHKHNDEDLNKLNSESKAYYWDSQFVVHKILNDNDEIKKMKSKTVFNKIGEIVKLSEKNNLNADKFQNNIINKLNQYFTIDSKLKNEEGITYSIAGSHAHGLEEYHFYLIKYKENQVVSKVEFLVHNQKTFSNPTFANEQLKKEFIPATHFAKDRNDWSKPESIDKNFKAISKIVAKSEHRENGEFKKEILMEKDKFITEILQPLAKYFDFTNKLEESTKDKKVEYSIARSHPHPGDYHFYLYKFINGKKSAKISFHVYVS